MSFKQNGKLKANKFYKFHNSHLIFNVNSLLNFKIKHQKCLSHVSPISPVDSVPTGTLYDETIART